MKNLWLALLLCGAAPAFGQFVKNNGIALSNTADVTVNSDWDNSNAGFTNNGTITTNDNWTSTGGYSSSGTGGFVLTNAATKQFNHAGQSIGTLTKSGSGNTQINNHIIVQGSLTLTNGLLSMTGANDTLVVKASATISGGTSTSYVTGKISRYGNGDLFFPTSAAGNYMPITIYQVSGTNPRVTISVQSSPGGYSINGAGNSLIPFPYVWKSGVVRGDTASYVELQYPSSLITTPTDALVSRSVDPSHYASMGVQSLMVAGGVIKIKSYTKGLRGLFSVAKGSLLPLDAPVATAATSISNVSFTANWSAVNNATSYLVDVSTDNFATFVAGFHNLLVAGTNVAVTGLTAATTYKFRVTAVGTPPTSPLSNSIDVTTGKAGQTIAFSSIADRVLGDAAFGLTATASSGLGVSFGSSSDKVTISGSQVTLVKPGRVTITATQGGNGSFNAASGVDQSFCIRPARPTVVLSGANTETITLTSSASTGNQWYINGSAISDATNSILSVSGEGIYKVQVKADDCVSDFSADSPIIVTGDLMSGLESVTLNPNPAVDFIDVHGLQRLQSSQVFDMSGRSSLLPLEKKGKVHHGNIQHLAPGAYVLKVQDDVSVHQIKFIKK